MYPSISFITALLTTLKPGFGLSVVLTLLWADLPIVFGAEIVFPYEPDVTESLLPPTFLRSPEQNLSMKFFFLGTACCE